MKNSRHEIQKPTLSKNGRKLLPAVLVTNLFVVLYPNIESLAIFVVGARRIELVFQCFDILSKSNLSFRTE